MILYFMILQVLHLCKCYDIELEGIVRVKKDFLNKLNGDNSEHPSARLVPKVEFFNFNVPSRNTKSVFQRTRPLRRLFHTDQFIIDYEKLLINKGVQSLKSLEKTIKKQINVYNANESVVPIIKDYKTVMRTHFDMIETYKSEYDYSWKLILCDIIETSNNILYSFKKRVIDDIVFENNPDILMLQNIIVEVFRENVYNKRDEFNYICKEVNVCHTYPGFSDYIADLISEILKLDNNKFGLAMQSLRKLIINRVTFLTTVIPDEVMTLIGIKIKPAAEIDLQMRELLSVLRAVIIQRYKLVLSKDEGVKMRTSAIRILLDIIDKAFGIGDESIMSIHFDSTVQGLRQYAAGQRNDINSTLYTFVTHIMGVLKHQLDKSTKDEVKALSEVIITGMSKDMDRFRYLFTKGSNLDPKEL